MPIDWNQVTANAQRTERERRDREAVEGITVKHKLSPDEAAWLATRRKEEAEAAEKAKHQADVKGYASFATRKAETARKAGDDGAAKVWTTAADNIGKGVWTVARVISSDPEVVRFQGLRTALCYEGKTAQLREPSAFSTYMKENEGA